MLRRRPLEGPVEKGPCADDYRPMATPLGAAHRAQMAEIVVLLCTGLAFLALVAAVPLEMDEERQDERERRLHPGSHKP